ncbi:hypothetical protein [Streptomyces luteolus]|uniref:Uncharacterized protein n=1 Tax=Streptomyces luteolus TaxID=3043615 RepID=A0ABT6STH9_9ACTN|nr:hypothetical protein [Streptomyces sp. B-S-A12]MDI3417957.1 hypothetical protein [Streptomyces sp. B-S-A12]
MEDWDQSKADATADTRLNQVHPSGGAGGTSDLTASPTRKRAAAKAIETRLEPETARDGRHAESSMNAAAKEFGAKDGEGWQTSKALKKALESWESQVKGLVHRLTNEKSQLREVASRFDSTEGGTAEQLSRMKSGIDGL